MRYFIILLVTFLVGCSEQSTDVQKVDTDEDKIIKNTHEELTADTPYSDEYTKAGWTLTFRDEFEQEETSSKQWNKINSGYKDHGRLQYYLPEQVSIDSGILRLDVNNNQYENFPYRSGSVTTQNIHEQLYGKYEIRAKFPIGQGLFPAIWLLPTNNLAFPEIDIAEMLGQLPNEIWHVAHKGEGNREFKLTENINGGEWHVYTLDWLENELVFYIDGTEQFRTPNISHTNMYLIMNVAVGGVWVGDPDDQTNFPSAMEVDYVRIYSQNNE